MGRLRADALSEPMTGNARTLCIGAGGACIVASWPLFTFGHLFAGMAAMLGGFAVAQLPFGWRAVASPLSAIFVAPVVFWLLQFALEPRSRLPGGSLLIYYLAGVPIAFMAMAAFGLPLIALLSLRKRPGPVAFVAIGMLSGMLVLAAIAFLVGEPGALLSAKQARLLVIAGLTGAVSGFVFSYAAGIRRVRSSSL